jgi:hypothetical protein
MPSIQTLRDSRGFQVCVVRGGALSRPEKVKATASKRGDGYGKAMASLKARLAVTGKVASAPVEKAPASMPHVMVRECRCGVCNHPVQPCKLCAVKTGCLVHVTATLEAPCGFVAPTKEQWATIEAALPNANAEFEAVHGVTLKAWMKAHNK